MALVDHRISDGSPAGIQHPEHVRDLARAVGFVRSWLLVAGLDAGGQARVESLVGRADLDASQVEELRATIVGSGAVARLEDEITRLADAATSALGDATSIGDEARAALLDLVGITTARTA